MAQQRASLCVVLALLGAVFVCNQFSLVSGACAGGVATALAANTNSNNGGGAAFAAALVGNNPPPPPTCNKCCDIDCPGLLGLPLLNTVINRVCGLVCGYECPDGVTLQKHNPCEESVCDLLCGNCKCKAKKCDAGWTSYNGNCYKYFSTPKTQDAAETDCVNNQGHLASIHSKAENDYVSSLVIPASNHIWIGMEIGHPGADWHITCAQNTDGTPCDYGCNPQVQGVFPWCAGYGGPKNLHGNDNCVKAHPGDPGVDAGCWNDWLCSAALPYVCKKPSGCA